MYTSGFNIGRRRHLDRLDTLEDNRIGAAAH